MAISVTPAISASTIVNILPSVLSAGGIGVQLNGLMLTTNTKPPIGQVISFPNTTSVSQYFGPTAVETALATIYFLGFQNSQQKPGSLLFSQYPWQQPVPAYLRGGSLNLTLPQLQALSGQLSVTINSTPVTASISLSGATSFSNAGEIIGNTLSIVGLNQGSYVGTIAGGTLTISTVTNGPQLASFIGTIVGGTLTVTSVTSGYVQAGLLLVGTGVTVGTTITAALSGQGSVGTYSISPVQTAASETITGYQNSGAIAVGNVIQGTGVSSSTYVTAALTGTGGVGTYSITPNQTAANGTMTAALPAVTYDPVLNAFVIASGTAGASSTITYASGALAVSLNLTQAGGAVLSQGTGQYTPANAMSAITAITQNWASFMTLFEPSDADKIGFSTWNNGQLNQYHYAMWDTNVANTQAGGPSSAVGTITLDNLSGTSLIHVNPAIETTGQIAAFILGYGASINFNAFQGRATAAFKSQSGLAPEVFNTSVYTFLLSYGMNCYGDFTTANEAFIFYSNGSVSGPFQWLDSYLDQIWLRSNLQNSLMALLTQVNSIPYNTYGYGLVQAACEDPIQAAVFAGVIQPGVPLSQAQIAEVFSITGNTNVAPVLQSRGWFLQIQPASAQVRVARQSPVINLLYTDGESIQQIVLNAIDVQ